MTSITTSGNTSLSNTTQTTAGGTNRAVTLLATEIADDVLSGSPALADVLHEVEVGVAVDGFLAHEHGQIAPQDTGICQQNNGIRLHYLAPHHFFSRTRGTQNQALAERRSTGVLHTLFNLGITIRQIKETRLIYHHRLHSLHQRVNQISTSEARVLRGVQLSQPPPPTCPGCRRKWQRMTRRSPPM
jgi:hypothetical protein